MSAEAFDPFAGAPILRTYPTTAVQREIWLAVQFGGREANLAYSEGVVVSVDGPLDISVLDRSLQQLVSRHESLRSTFTKDGQTVVVGATWTGSVVVSDLRALNVAEARERRDGIVAAETTVEFDLVSGPLFRARIILLADSTCEVVLVAHHLVCDGWSTGVLLAELSALYSAELRGERAPLKEAPRFSDYVGRLRDSEVREQAFAAEKYWLERLASPPPALELPLDHARPAVRRFDAARRDWLLGPELADALRVSAKRLGVSLPVLLGAALDVLLYRLSGQRDFVVAMPMAGQLEFGEHGLVGHCVNTVPLRVNVDPRESFAKHALEMGRVVVDAAEHQHLSLGDLLRKLGVRRDASRVPLASVLFNVDPEMPEVRFGELGARVRTIPRVAEHFELFLNATEISDGIQLEATFGLALFDEKSIDGWLASYETLLGAVVRDPNGPTGELEVLSPREKRYLLEELNATKRDFPEQSALQLIEQQCRRSPDAVAVRSASVRLTYGELDQLANGIAHELVARGVREGDAVGVSVSRTSYLPATLLAVWKCGAFYVPIDPTYPKERLDYIVADSRLRVLVEDAETRGLVGGVELTRVEVGELSGRADSGPVRSDDRSQLAYVIHTSGSTGTPKGVQIEQGSLANLLLSLVRRPGIHPGDVFVAVTTLSFDIAAAELFGPLIVGAQVVIASRDEVVDGARLGGLLDSVGATLMQATPSGFRVLLEAGWGGRSALRAWVGGEALPRDLARRLLPKVRELWNLYGPTETTVWASTERIDTDEDITIGRPLDNTVLYVLDENLRPVPRGALGELYVGGPQVARGYLHRPDLTAERFHADPFGVGGSARIYRTGDLCRIDRFGRVVYEGRTDFQVKLRGYRIELGEIEATLATVPGVGEAVVVLHTAPSREPTLVAYVSAPTERQPDRSALAEVARARLPSYMLPSHYVVLDRLPLTPNGKVDRRALPAPEGAAVSDETLLAPRTPTEQRLAALWRELLHLREVGIASGFFELGGHSMLAVRMLSRVAAEFGVEFPLRVVFQAQTIEALGLLIDAHHVRGTSDAVADDVREEIEF